MSCRKRQNDRKRGRKNIDQRHRPSNYPGSYRSKLKMRGFLLSKNDQLFLKYFWFNFLNGDPSTGTGNAKLVRMKRKNISSFNGPASASFCFRFVLFKHKMFRKNCMLQRDSNSDCRMLTTWPPPQPNKNISNWEIQILRYSLCTLNSKVTVA